MFESPIPKMHNPTLILELKCNLMSLWDEGVGAEKRAAGPRFLRQSSLMPDGTASSRSSAGQAGEGAQPIWRGPRQVSRLQAPPGPHAVSPSIQSRACSAVLMAFHSLRVPWLFALANLLVRKQPPRSSERTWPVPRADSADNLLNGNVNACLPSAFSFFLKIEELMCFLGNTFTFRYFHKPLSLSSKQKGENYCYTSKVDCRGWVEEKERGTKKKRLESVRTKRFFFFFLLLKTEATVNSKKKSRFSPRRLRSSRGGDRAAQAGGSHPPPLAAKLGAAARAPQCGGRGLEGGTGEGTPTPRAGEALPAPTSPRRRPGAGRTEGGSRLGCRPAGFLKGTLGNPLQELGEERGSRGQEGEFDGCRGWGKRLWRFGRSSLAPEGRGKTPRNSALSPRWSGNCAHRREEDPDRRREAVGEHHPCLS